MPETNITNAETGAQASTFKDYSVTPVSTDSAGDQEETEWINANATQYLGYYKTIPELQSAINAKAYWTVGKGFTSNEITEMLLSSIKGFGKDTFNSILENLIRDYSIYGDAFAEVIRDEDDVLINLKVLDPAKIKIVADSKGLIKRYEQTSKVKGGNKKFQPEEILHLARNRVADEIHGVSLIPAVEQIILMRNEAMADYRKLLHRNIYPVRIWHLDTDVPTKISAFKAKVADAKYKGEDMFIPKGSVETEIAAIPANSTLDPKAWITQLTQYFYQAAEVPQIIVGGSNEITEAGAKISYLAYQQPIEKEQLFIEEQILSQLNLEIHLTFPASLQNEMLSDKAKEESTQAATPEDTSVTQAEGQVGEVKE